MTQDYKRIIDSFLEVYDLLVDEDIKKVILSADESIGKDVSKAVETSKLMPSMMAKMIVPKLVESIILLQAGMNILSNLCQDLPPEL